MNVSPLIRLRLLRPALTLLALYWAYAWGFRVLSLTFVTALVTSSLSTTPRLEDINETLATHALLIQAIGAICLIIGVRAFSPVTRWKLTGFFDTRKLEGSYFSGFSSGAVLAAAVTLALILSGNYSFLGVFIQFDAAPLSAASLLIRALAIMVLTYVEAYFFWEVLVKRLRDFLNEFPTTLGMLCLISASFVATKAWAFDLGLMQSLSLFLLGISLGLRSIVGSNFTLSAGFYAGLLVVLHVVLSLPIFGIDGNGLFLVKYLAGSTELPSAARELSRILTGGLGGPLSSIVLQVILILDVVQTLLKYQKNLLRRLDPKLN